MRIVMIMAVVVSLTLGTAAMADPDTEREVRQTIIDNNQALKKSLKADGREYSSQGAVEFWSSGGLMQDIDPNGRPGEFEMFNIDVKHIRITTLDPGKIALAHYYSEGAMKPKGFPAVSNYRTRVSQVYVKEGGKWKVRASHWSAISGGSGTSQTALEEE